jgi:hypothetical protein
VTVVTWDVTTGGGVLLDVHYVFIWIPEAESVLFRRGKRIEDPEVRWFPLCDVDNPSQLSKHAGPDSVEVYFEEVLGCEYERREPKEDTRNKALAVSLLESFLQEIWRATGRKRTDADNAQVQCLVDALMGSDDV